MPTKSYHPGMTLLEILVVLAVLGVASAFVTPNILDWNCRQEARNDFERLNGFMQTLRLEAVNRNSTMLARVYRSGNNAIIRAYQGPQGNKKSCSGGGWNYRGQGVNDIMDYRSEKSSLSFVKRDICFEADGTATPTSINNYAYLISRQCGIKPVRNFQYKNQIFGATGFIEKMKYNLTSSKWEEL